LAGYVGGSELGAVDRQAEGELGLGVGWVDVFEGTPVELG